MHDKEPASKRKAKRRRTPQPATPPRKAGAVATRAPRPGALVADLTLVALLTAYTVIVVRTAWLSDDAYITFRTIDNFIGGYGLRWNVAERVQAFTHPLWMLLLSALYVLTHEIYLTAIIFSVILSIAAVALLGLHARRRVVHPLVLVALLGMLLFSRAFIDYSTSGLENPLSHLLLVAFIAVVFDERHTDTRRLFLLSVLAGLGTLNRMDTALLFVPALAWELWQARSIQGVQAVGLGFAPFGLWEAFSVVYYGFPFPNTAYAKLRTGIGRLDYWEHGFAYFKNSLICDPTTLLAICGALIVGLGGRDAKVRALAVGVLLYLVYIINIGGDFMAGRFFAAPLLVSVMLLIEAGLHLRTTWPRRLAPAAVLFAGLIGTTPTFLSGSDYGGERNQILDETGVADERAYYYPMTGLLTDTSIAERPASEAAVKGRNARTHGDPLIVDGIVGFTGFFAGAGTYIVDYHALGDPLLARLPMVKSDPLFGDFCMRLKGHPCLSTWRVGHYVRNVPDGYLDSVLEDENRLVDGNLHKLYEPIRAITRGRIWSAERWLAIAKMNLGLLSDLAGGSEQADYRGTPFTKTYEHFPDVRSVSVLSGAAREYVEHEAPEKAIECYQKLVAIDPTSDEAWNNLGQLLLWRGDNAGGEAALLEAIKLRPAHLQPYSSLAEQLNKTGRQAEVVPLFQRLAVAGDAMAAEYLRRASAAH